MSHKVPGLFARVLRLANLAKNQGEYVPHAEPIVVDADKANIITSKLDGLPEHALVLDLDFPATLIPSSTPGHFHLVLDKQVEWDKAVLVLDAMAAAGLLEDGYVKASKARGYTAIRVPWVKKIEKKEEDDPF